MCRSCMSSHVHDMAVTIKADGLFHDQIRSRCEDPIICAHCATQKPQEFRRRIVLPPCDVVRLMCAWRDVKVDAAKVGQALYPLVMAEKDAGSREGGLPIGARALSAFRELYRFTWDEPRVRGQESDIEQQIR